MIELIPAIDIMDGRCVRLTMGDYATGKTYYDDPLEAALQYADAGVRRLHMVDLDGAKRSEPANLAVLERVASRTDLDIQYGGGVKSERALRDVLSAGAQRAICGSVAVSDPRTLSGWLKAFGAGRVILGADVRDGLVATHGWLAQSGVSVEELIANFLPDGLRQVICTEISRDGMLAGPDFELYERLYARFPDLEIIASGGVGGMGDILRLERRGVRGVIVGKAIYEGRITLEEIKKHIACQ